MTIRRVQIIAETVRKLVIPVTAVVFLIETILWQGSLNRPEKIQSRRATRLTADRNSVRMEKAGRVVQILTRHSVPWKRTIRIREARVQKWKAAQIIWMQFAARARETMRLKRIRNRIQAHPRCRICAAMTAHLRISRHWTVGRRRAESWRS